MRFHATQLRQWAAAFTLGVCALAASSARAQAWPTKPIRLIVASAPAGNIDLVAHDPGKYGIRVNCISTGVIRDGASRPEDAARILVTPCSAPAHRMMSLMWPLFS